ncbi:hypothetical protein BO70DRAFT_406219 [Aspergillus heteromorphus CBS 117.55]|uniref:DUF7905 domain-containing protein n=1 Tax=Aspergillus heteromorphus CBS 117.55 TaxID=1448321 RepID=A0A317W8E2_9EURO|nr:uncharacterized protein BO70DRAFT_406219 [Aspergillus heteromorphus CBS 117.55]PWY81981.1 hypothetical protein BO70DRAFT_406219 [Aspergillus heteromorphus CBS 117.55]
MSFSSPLDHESSGAQEWRLVGYGKQGPKASRAKESVANEPRGSLAKNAVRNEPSKAPAPSTPAAATNTPGRSRGAKYSARRYSSSRGRGGIQSTTPPTNLFKDSPAKSRWRSGSDPTGLVKLPAPFGILKNEFFGLAKSSGSIKKSSAPQGRHEVFEEICKKTGAFIKPPSYTDHVIYLWGEASQVSAAKDFILSIITKCSLSHKKRTEWNKIKAHSINKEANIDLRERHDAIIQVLRKAPDDISLFPEQLLFLWPKDGPSLSESLGSQLESLDYIRAKFNCHMFVPKDIPNHICVLGHSYDNMIQIVQRLRIKWTETIANTNMKAKAYIIEPPGTMKRIVVKNDTFVGKAFLDGARPKGPDVARWRSRADLIRSKNNTRLLNVVEKCLKGVAAVRGHLRMRVNIGSFVLDEYRLPADGGKDYDFEEFREMMLHEQTKGRLIPGLKVQHEELLARCYKATHLLEPYDTTTGSLENAEPAFSVNFEFQGNRHSMLRLEAEFTKSPGAHDYEITQRRWLRTRSMGQHNGRRSPLQVGITDFERSDWQLELKSLEFHEASSIDAYLREFSHTIRFQRTANVDDISAKPERKVTFSASAPVSRFIEKTAIRYRLKGTKCILEIARYDEYTRTVPASPDQMPQVYVGVGPFTGTPHTSWGASVFDPTWDNLLGEHGNLQVGHAAGYNPGLDTFFSPKDPSNNKDKRRGFWDFVNMVKQIAEMMGPTGAPQTFSERNTPANNERSLQTGTTKDQGASGGSSPATGPTDLGGLLYADLGTLF